jgi:hypothetical protein
MVAAGRQRRGGTWRGLALLSAALLCGAGEAHAAGFWDATPVSAAQPFSAPEMVTSGQRLSECERAGVEAEQAAGLPAGLLLAIGRVESGRWDTVLGRVIPWPWSIDAAGQPHLFDSKDAAMDGARGLHAAAGRNLDIGCFQISMLHHPDAFADLAEAFDPRANAAYAARFLMSLRQRLGSWEAAVMAYHSAVPELGIPYRERVFAQWNGRPAVIAEPEPAPEAPPAGPKRDPYVMLSGGPTGVAVWTPSPLGRAPSLVAMPVVQSGPVMAAREP